jgi:transcriptional regulator with XRE-family HTH domain
MNKVNFMNQFGEFLKELRGKRSLREIERLSGVSHVQLSNLEKGVDPRTGKRSEPSIETLTKLSKAFDIPLNDMISKAYIKTFIISPDEAKKITEEDNELRKKKDILDLLQNKDDNVYYNGQMLSPEDRKRVLTVLQNLLPEYHKD